ncbi:putative tetratricopeptide-like helical domain superfamily [Dioscorea sansibarensis]
MSQRILRALSRLQTPSQLPQIQTQLIIHDLLLNTTISSSFITTSTTVLRLLSPSLLVFRHLPRYPPHPFLSNTLLHSLSLLHLPHLLLLTFSLSHSSSFPSNHNTFPLVLKPLAYLRLLPHGTAVHALTVKTAHSTDLYVLNSLLNLYSSCGDLQGCEKLFDEMPNREVVAWSTMIMAYRTNGKLDQSLIMFERMQFAGVAPNRVTMVNALAACAASGAVEMGEWIHNYVRRSGWALDVVLGTSLVDMYSKCGRIEDAVKVFDEMPDKNVCTWNSVIGGMAMAKCGEEAVRWFMRMEHEGVRPDTVTLVGMLCACSHAGMVEMGRRLFRLMFEGKYGFQPGIKHYGCMVDMFCRAGMIGAAMEFVERMPWEPNVVIWGSLLKGSRAHGDVGLSEAAARRLVEIEPGNVVHYVVLGGLYAEMGRWKEAEELRRRMKAMGLRKDAGWSLAENDEAMTGDIEKHIGVPARIE